MSRPAEIFSASQQLLRPLWFPRVDPHPIIQAGQAPCQSKTARESRTMSLAAQSLSGRPFHTQSEILYPGDCDFSPVPNPDLRLLPKFS